jgi:hypothetical protein
MYSAIDFKHFHSCAIKCHSEVEHDCSLAIIMVTDPTPLTTTTTTSRCLLIHILNHTRTEHNGDKM